MERIRQRMLAGTESRLTWAAAALLACLPTMLLAQEIVPPSGFDGMDADWPWADHHHDDACMHDMRRCCGDCCCPSWDTYAIFDVLYLQRNNAIGDSPLVLTDLGVPVMTSQDLQPGMATGTRVFFGRLINEDWGWEIGYTGIYGMFGDALVTAPDGLQLPPDLGNAVSNFGDAQAVRGTYWSSLNMTEVNLFRYRCCRECRPTRLACTNCRPNCHCINWIGGFVWAGLDEQSALTATCCDPPEPSAYAVQTTTNYFGPQIGMRGRREWCRWAVEGWWKTALCGTAASQGQAPIVDTVTGLQERGALRSSDAGVGFIGSLNATLIYRLTRIWGLRAGYNAYWLTNAAFAPNQWDFSTASTAGTTIRDNGTLFLHGVSLGVEARW